MTPNHEMAVRLDPLGTRYPHVAHSEKTGLFPFRSPARAGEDTSVSFTETFHPAIRGEIRSIERTITYTRKRCFCGRLFLARGRWHVFCSRTCKDRSKYLKRKARKHTYCLPELRYDRQDREVA